MEGCRLKLGGMALLLSERTLEPRSWQNGGQLSPRAEVIRPEPRRFTRTPFPLDSLSRFSSKSIGAAAVHREDLSLDILDMILNKAEADEDSESSNEASFFCGSPPLRANNPLIHDPQFGKQSLLTASPAGIFAGGVQRGSSPSSCAASSFGTKPAHRLEGFSCGSAENRHVLSALA